MDKRALCIGINDYPGTDSDLAGCVNDARDWSAALAARGFGVARLLDRRATGNGIREGITDLLKDARAGDLCVVQYSGHGSFVDDLDGDEADGTDECICPWDVRTRGAITDDELFRLYSQRAHGVKLVIFSDSCFSGTVARFAPISTPASAAGGHRRTVRFLPPQHFLTGRRLARLGRRRARRAASPPGRYAGLLMAGCQETEYSYDAYFKGRPNGAFTFVALRALEKLGAASTYHGWFAKIRAVLPSQQYPQSPNLFGPSAMKRWRILQ